VHGGLLLGQVLQPLLEVLAAAEERPPHPAQHAAPLLLLFLLPFLIHRRTSRRRGRGHWLPCGSARRRIRRMGWAPDPARAGWLASGRDPSNGKQGKQEGGGVWAGWLLSSRRESLWVGNGGTQPASVRVRPCVRVSASLLCCALTPPYVAGFVQVRRAGDRMLAFVVENWIELGRPGPGRPP
jgi:hypothetical protein